MAGISGGKMIKKELISEKITIIENLIEELEFTPSRFPTLGLITEIKEILDSIKELLREK